MGGQDTFAAALMMRQAAIAQAMMLGKGVGPAAFACMGNACTGSRIVLPSEKGKGGIPAAFAGRARSLQPGGNGKSSGPTPSMLSAVSEGLGASLLVGSTVESWDPRGYGFVRTDNGTRAYVHADAFGGGGDLFLGERVKVSISPDTRDQKKFKAPVLLRHNPPLKPGEIEREDGWQKPADDTEVRAPATNTPGPPPLTEADMGEDKWANAAVVQWHEDRGFGFVSMEDGRRAYVHHSVFGGGALTVGHSCRVLVCRDRVNTGKWMVAAITGDGNLVLPGGGTHWAKRPRLV